jgi:hypothetical protein
MPMPAHRNASNTKAATPKLTKAEAKFTQATTSKGNTTFFTK